MRVFVRAYVRVYEKTFVRVLLKAYEGAYVRADMNWSESESFR